MLNMQTKALKIAGIASFVLLPSMRSETSSYIDTTTTESRGAGWRSGSNGNYMIDGDFVGPNSATNNAAWEI